MIDIRKWKRALDACHRAARVHQDWFGRATEMIKPDGSPVTSADREAEAGMRSIVLAAYPDDGFVGEENGVTEGASGHTWVADPLDGTIQFVSGMTDFGVLLARRDWRGTELGILCHSMSEEFWIAERGKGAWRTDHQAIGLPESEVRLTTDAKTAPKRIERTIVCFGHLHRMDGAGMDVGMLVSRFKTHLPVPRFRMFTLVAEGKLDVVVARLEHDWDLLANKIIVEEAGGAVIILPLRNGRWVVAARSVELAEQTIEAIRECIY